MQPGFGGRLIHAGGCRIPAHAAFAAQIKGKTEPRRRGAVGAFIVGVMWLNEGLHPMRVAAAFLIVAGLVLMRLAPAS